MRLVGTRVIEAFCKSHADASAPLGAWLKVAEEAAWRHLLDLKKTYPHADYFRPYTVFNIKGNSYRLISIIDYRQGIIYIDQCLTHSQYDRDKWKR